MTGLIALADDLSGAAEAATLLAGVDDAGNLLSTAAITSYDHLPDLSAHPGVLVIDTDTRHRTPEERRHRVSDAALAASAAGGSVVFCKIDSLLRGGVSSLLAGLLDVGLRPVLAPALPSLGRVTSHGRVLVHGTPLSRTSLLDDESIEARGDVRTAVGPVPSAVLGLDVVRGPEAQLRSAIHTAVEQGTVPIVDASTDHDLDRLVGAARSIPRLVLTGAGGLAAALGRVTGSARHWPASPQRRSTIVGTSRLLIVVGSRSAAARAQLATLAKSGWTVAELPKELLLRAGAAGSVDGIDHAALDAARAALAGGKAAISIGHDGAVSYRSAHRLADGLGVIASALGNGAALVLTGGETARAVLTHLEVRSLQAAGVIEAGCVLSYAEDGRPIITRPGSFGTADNLVDLAHALTRLRAAGPTSPVGKADH